MPDLEVPFTLDQLAIVRAIAEHGSFRKAADKLYVSQPAVSLQIQNLERQLGMVLFDRGGRRVQLTEAGRILVGYGERILKLCQETQRALDDLSDLKRGTLVLGASQTVGTYVMPQLISQFRQAHPQISVQLMVHSTRRIALKLVNGEIDLAIVGGEVPKDMASTLEILPFAQDEYVLVKSGNSQLGHRCRFGEGQAPHPNPNGSRSTIPASSELQTTDLLTLEFITLDPQSSTRQTIDRVLSHHEIDPAQFQSQLELSSIEAIKNAVQAGLGVAFLSLAAVGAELARGDLQQLNVKGLQVKRTLWLLSNPERYQSQASKIFRHGLLEQTGWLNTPLPYLYQFPPPTPAPEPDPDPDPASDPSHAQTQESSCPH